MSASEEIMKRQASFTEKRINKRLEALSKHLASLPQQKENGKEKLADYLAIVYTFLFWQKKHVREKEPFSIENRVTLIEGYMERISPNHENLIALLGQIQNLVFAENLECWQVAYEKTIDQEYGSELFKSASELAVYALNIQDAMEA